ncbi:LysR family transcriptional regulator [Paenibacillus swuensis]|uniref:LysR family transcriptional regulator n=1 Tax=Paenibacillus swuensis TaxID=1178515 RepID=A0A172TKA6_9BACL|nr:LysR family transcriptional regulator [Paenibacillus swuensis]ANE47495.1 LysR family transcriptional regulator [Paenibacillus swuensis]
METAYLETFREVAKFQSFTRAAESLGYAQSSVTAQIQKLEKEYGTPLFDRIGRKMKLTLAGTELLKYADHILTLLSESKDVISQSSYGGGVVTIATIESLAAFYLPPMLQAFGQHYPQVKIGLHPGVESTIIESVLDGRNDIGIILDQPYTDPDLHTVILRQEELVLIAKADHPFVSFPPITIQDLEHETFIVTELGCTYRSLLEKTFRKEGVHFRSSFELSSLEAIKQCVSYGLGIALVPRIAVEAETAEGKLAVLPFNHPDIRIYTQVIYHRRKWLSPPLKHLLELFS